MDHHEKHIRILGELLIQQPDKFISGVTVVDGQGTANPKHAGLFPRFGSDTARHGMPKARNALATAPLLCQADGSIGGQSGRGCRSRFWLLCGHDWAAAKVEKREKYRGLPGVLIHLELSLENPSLKNHVPKKNAGSRSCLHHYTSLPQ